MCAAAPRPGLALGLIDSGVRDDAFPVTARRVFLEAEGATIVHDHGTALARIIAAAIDPRRVRLYDAQIFGARLATSADAVAEALDWLAASAVDVVNMSFGLREDRPVLRNACLHTQERGALIVAATPIVGAPVYPAAYPGVLRASGDARCAGEQWSCFGTEPKRFGASPNAPLPLETDAPLRGGSSYACARLCGAVLALLERGIAREQIPDYLVEHATVTGVQTRPDPSD